MFSSDFAAAWAEATLFLHNLPDERLPHLAISYRFVERERRERLEKEGVCTMPAMCHVSVKRLGKEVNGTNYFAHPSKMYANPAHALQECMVELKKFLKTDEEAVDPFS